MSKLLAHKKALYALSSEMIIGKIERNKRSLHELKESASRETKSSAGDKHETGRAMVHLEQEKISKQLVVNLQNQNVIQQINPNLKMDRVGLGALVITNKLNFFVSVALGAIHYSGKEYFLLSLNSPIVQRFTGKQIGDKVRFNGQVYVVEDLI